MAVTVFVPGPLREHTGGAGTVVLPGPHATVADVLAALFRLHPGLRDRLLTEPGDLRQHVHLFVGAESIRQGAGLATAVADGAEVTILPAVSGGRRCELEHSAG
jgi:molybdopterin converting factor small subunit